MADDKLIPWKYCECGCKSYTCTIAGYNFSLFWDLKDGWYLTIYAGNGGTNYSSQEAVDEAVLDFLEKEKDKLIKTKNDIDKVLTALKERSNA